MTCASYRNAYLTTAWVISATLTACLNPQRKLPPAAAVGTVLVQLDNLSSTDRDQAGYLYVLGDCLPNVTGVLNAGVVSFTADGIRNGLSGCSMQIKTTQPISGAKFAAGADQTVLYSGQLSTFYLDLNGAIAAVAPLNKLYSFGDAPQNKTTSPATPPAPDRAVTITPHAGTN